MEKLKSERYSSRNSKSLEFSALPFNRSRILSRRMETDGNSREAKSFRKFYRTTSNRVFAGDVGSEFILVKTDSGEIIKDEKLLKAGTRWSKVFPWHR